MLLQLTRNILEMSNKSFIWPKPPDSDFMHPEAEALGGIFSNFEKFNIKYFNIDQKCPFPWLSTGSIKSKILISAIFTIFASRILAAIFACFGL